MLIFGVDGGADHKKHTKSDKGSGWCLMEAAAVNPYEPPKLLSYGQTIGGPDAFLKAMEKDSELAKAMERADQLIVEDFVQLNARADPGPLEVVGMIKMYGLLMKRPVATRMPSQRTLVSHEDLKANEMWPGGAGHADTAQAIRHVLSWLIANDHPGTIALFAPDPG